MSSPTTTLHIKGAADFPINGNFKCYSAFLCIPEKKPKPTDGNKCPQPATSERKNCCPPQEKPSHRQSNKSCPQESAPSQNEIRENTVFILGQGNVDNNCQQQPPKASPKPAVECPKSPPPPCTQKSKRECPKVPQPCQKPVQESQKCPPSPASDKKKESKKPPDCSELRSLEILKDEINEISCKLKKTVEELQRSNEQILKSTEYDRKYIERTESSALAEILIAAYDFMVTACLTEVESWLDGIDHTTDSPEKAFEYLKSIMLVVSKNIKSMKFVADVTNQAYSALPCPGQNAKAAKEICLTVTAKLEEHFNSMRTKILNCCSSTTNLALSLVVSTIKKHVDEVSRLAHTAIKHLSTLRKAMKKTADENLALKLEQQKAVCPKPAPLTDTCPQPQTLTCECPEPQPLTVVSPQSTKCSPQTDKSKNKSELKEVDEVLKEFSKYSDKYKKTFEKQVKNLQENLDNRESLLRMMMRSPETYKLLEQFKRTSH